MKIWIINNYNMLPQHGSLCRSYYFGKYMKKLGQEPTVFVGSHPHNTDLQLIADKSTYKISDECDFPWVLVKTLNYEGSMLKRVYSMLQFYFNMLKTAEHFDRPDAVIGSSAHPLAAVAAIKLGKKYHCKAAVEIRDLWPESIVAYGIASKRNPLIRLLYRLEKWLYTKADAVIFTMEGGRDYIIEKGWDKQTHGGPIDLDKVRHINNGVDLELFDYNRESFAFADSDLDDPETFKVVYAGAIRHVNQLSILVDTAAYLRETGDTKVRFLIYGDGNEREQLEAECRRRELNNIVFKGYIQKKYIPYILSKASLNLLQYGNTPILQYGISMNKSFEYLAAGKPILGNIAPQYDYIESRGCGIMRKLTSAKEYGDAILAIANMSESEYAVMCEKARETAKQYDFRVLTEKLISAVQHST